MPKVEQATMQDVASKQRAKLRKLMAERVTLQYGFSHKRLTDAFIGLGLDPDDAAETIRECVLSPDDKSKDAKKKELNEEISVILTENNLPGLRDQDPLGRTVDCLYYESKAADRFVENKAVAAAPGLGISVKKALELIHAGMEEGKPYAVLTIREVKE